jgi:hypothetical protein
MRLANQAQDLHAVHVRHQDVEQDQVIALAADPLERLVAAGCDRHRESPARKPPRQHVAVRLVVVYEQQGGGVFPWTLAAGARRYFLASAAARRASRRASAPGRFQLPELHLAADTRRDRALGVRQVEPHAERAALRVDHVVDDPDDRAVAAADRASGITVAR